MKRLGGWSFALNLLWGLLAWGTVGPTEPPDESWLRIQKTRPENPPVRFSHRRHPKPKIACEQCHHDYKGGRNLWREGQPVEKCQACAHRLIAQRGVLGAQDAFHRQCKGDTYPEENCGRRPDPSSVKTVTHTRNEEGDEGESLTFEVGATPLISCV